MPARSKFTALSTLALSLSLVGIAGASEPDVIMTGGYDTTSGEDTGWDTTSGEDTGWDTTTGGFETGGDDDSGGSEDTGAAPSDEFVDLWEPGEMEAWLGEWLWLLLFGGDTDEGESGSESGSDEGGDDCGDDSGEDTGAETGADECAPEKPKHCADGEFTIITFLKWRNGAEGTLTLAHGTLTELESETEGTTIKKMYLACIPGDKILGPQAPGVRISAAVAGTNPQDYVVGIRRGIDKNWIGKCLGDPAKSCWIDAKFNAEGKNLLPIGTAVVYAEFVRVEVAPMPHEVKLK